MCLSLLALAGCGAAPQADETGEDQQAVSPPFVWTYGGSFQIDDCGGDNVGNALNGGAFNCAFGFFQRPRPATANVGNRQLDPESRCGGNDYFCTKDGYPQLGPGGTGGMFQLDDCLIRKNVGNSANGGNFSCPTWPAGSSNRNYVATRMARVLNPESGCGAWQYVCTGGTGRDHYFGGTYQVDDCGQNTKNNPLTSAPNCPTNYVPQRYGRVKGAEGSQCGVTQYWCDGGLSGL